MDEHIYKSHNKTLLLYHLVFPAKYDSPEKRPIENKKEFGNFGQAVISL